MDKLGVTTTQLTALMVLKERENCLMKELADALMLDNSAVTGLAKRLQANGLINREPCKTDSRAIRLSTSKRGKEILEKGMTLLHQVNAEMNAGFSESELDTVSRYLQHVTQLFSLEKK